MRFECYSTADINITQGALRECYPVGFTLLVCVCVCVRARARGRLCV